MHPRRHRGVLDHDRSSRSSSSWPACLAVYEAHRSDGGWVPTIAPALVALAAGQLVMWAARLDPAAGPAPRAGPDQPQAAPRPRPRIGRTDHGGGGACCSPSPSPAAVPPPPGATMPPASRPEDRSSLPFDARRPPRVRRRPRRRPRGQWLMAAVSIDDLDPADRRVFVDAARWDAVVGDFMRRHQRRRRRRAHDDPRRPGRPDHDEVATRSRSA